MTMREYDMAAVRDLAEDLQWTPTGAEKREPSLARTWHKLNTVSVAGEPRAGAGAALIPVRPRRRRLAPIAVGLLVLGLVAGVAVLTMPGLRPGSLRAGVPSEFLVSGAEVPIAEAWGGLIEAARTATPIAVPPGSTLYVKVAALGMMVGRNPWVPQQQDAESWVNPDGLRTIRMLRDGPADVDATGAAEPFAGPASLQQPTPAWLVGLPTDPDELANLLLGQSNPGDWSRRHGVWDTLGQFVASGGDVLLPITVRAALYQALADEPGLIATQLTLGGRDLLGIGRIERERGQQLLFDPSTGRLVGDRSSYLGDNEAGKPADGTMSWRVTQVVAVVPSVGARP